MTRLITEIFALKFVERKEVLSFRLSKTLNIFFILLQTRGIINIIGVHFLKST